MEYNSEREPMIISEYGRSVQDLVYYAKKIENKEEKQAYFDEIIELIMRMKVNGKKSIEYKEKVWRHLFKIASYELDGVVMPNGEIPQAKADNFKPPRLDYPTSEKRFRHYGHNVQVLIKKAIEMEDGPKKKEFVRVIASFMKLAYKTWNPEHYMNESMIRLDLETLSDKKLSLDPDANLDAVGQTQFNKKKKSYITQNNQKGKKKPRKRK